MKRKKIVYFFAYFLCFNIFFGNFSLAAESREKEEEIIVKFKNESKLEFVKVPCGILPEDFLAEYQKKKNIEYAELNSLYKISIIPNDTYYNKQWYLKKIEAPSAWERVRETPEKIIAVIDSGVQIKHPDLGPNIWINEDEIPGNRIDDDKNGFIDDYNGWDFVNNAPDPSPKFEKDFTEAGIMHGTVVAGIIAGAGNNNSGVAGITWKAKIMPLKVLNDKGEGRVKEVIQAIDYAINNKADIINFSFVGLDYSQALYEAIVRAYRAGIIMVAAAGNEQDDGDGYDLNKTPMYPACHDGHNGENMVIGVAATDAIDQKAPFSSYGFSCVDISAPGESFYSTVVYKPLEKIGGKALDQYFGGFWSGTSMAAPIVSGAIALIEKINPEMEPSDIKNVLFDSAENISRLNPDYLGQLGKGRINLFRAVDLAERRLKNKKIKILTAPYSNHLSQIKEFEKNGKLSREFLAYGDNFRGGASIAGGDVNGDGEDEIITGAGFGGGPQIMVFDSKGNLLSQFFAYDKNFRGGVNVAVGDIDGDNKEEIIVGAGNTGGPHVRVFNGKGELVSQFFAYDKNFRGGVNVAVGDVNGDFKDEIITGAGVGGGPHVRFFDYKGNLFGQFFAYDKNFRGGVNVAVGDIDGGTARKKDEIIVSPLSGGGPHIRVFNDSGDLLYDFYAYEKNFSGGVNIAVEDADSDGFAEIITGAGKTGGPHIRIFEPNGTLIDSFYAYEKNFSGGVNVGAIVIKN